MDLLEEIWTRPSQHPAGIPYSDESRPSLTGGSMPLRTTSAGRPLGRPWSEVRERLKPRRSLSSLELLFIRRQRITADLARTPNLLTQAGMRLTRAGLR